MPSDGTTPLPVLVNGEPERVDEDRAKKILSLGDIEFVVDLGMGGEGEATYWTCDFSYVSAISCKFPLLVLAISLTSRIGICQDQRRLQKLNLHRKYLEGWSRSTSIV